MHDLSAEDRTDEGAKAVQAAETAFNAAIGTVAA